MNLTLTATERNALYRQALGELTVFDDLREAWERGDVETSYRLGRACSDWLRLIVDGLGWGEHASSELVELRIPATELTRIFSRLRDSATLQYEAERSDQEEFRANWERAGLVRDTCTAKLEAINQVAGAAPGAEP
ncbi:MAG TPA: hypothetical protein VF125_08200 [Solirubrobacterales bacterium]